MKRVRFIATVLVLFSVATLLTLPQPAQSQAPSDIESRINALLTKMTLAEKLGQLQQLDGDFPTGIPKPEQPDLVRKGLLGSTLNVRGAKNTNQFQKIAVEESRLKIPLLFGFDVIHGYRTVFPLNPASSKSWLVQIQ